MGEQNKNIFTDTTINGVPVGLYKETIKELERRRSVLKEGRLNYQPILDELNKSIFEMEKLLKEHKTLVAQGEEKTRYFFCTQQPTIIRKSPKGLYRRDDNGGLYSIDVLMANIGYGLAIEVTAADLPYLEKPEGDWEFRKAANKDYIMVYHFIEGGHSHIAQILGTANKTKLSGYRWCKPRKEEGGSPASKHEDLLRSHREIVERSDKQKGKSNEIKLTEAEARLIQHAADAFHFINQEMSRCP